MMDLGKFTSIHIFYHEFFKGVFQAAFLLSTPILFTNLVNVFKHIQKAEKVTGIRLGPDDAYLITRGLRTLDVRLDRHWQNARKIAAFLSKNKKIKLSINSTIYF